MRDSAKYKNPLAKHCEGCWFLGQSLGSCNYLIFTGKRRPCPGGKGCTVKTVPGKNWRKYAPRSSNGGSNVGWDTEKGLKMWLNGRSYGEIAKEMGVTTGAIASYKKKHWENLEPMRKQKSKQERFKWDTKKGFAMYKAGASDVEIAKAVGRSPEAVRNYRVQYWGETKWDGQVKWDTEKARQMREQGISWAKVASAVGVSKGCVCSYASRHWRGEG